METPVKRPLEQQIRFCTTPDKVRIAYATVGKGPPLVRAAHWLTHLQYDLDNSCLGPLDQGILSSPSIHQI